MIVLKIAFRNLVEHKTKTAIIGFLIAFAIAFLVAGNSVMDGVKQGMRESYAANFTGDLIVHGVSEDDFSLFPGPALRDIPIIPAFTETKAAVQAAPSVSMVLPLVLGTATISIDEESAGGTLLWGVDFDDYRRMFPSSLIFIEGGFPNADGPQVLISEKVRERTEKESGHRLHVGDKITLGGIGSSGTRLREASVTGVFKFERGGEQLDMVSLIDADTLRSLKGMTELSAPPAKLRDIAPVEVSEDDLFSSTSLTETGEGEMGGGSIDFDNILGDVSVREKYATTDSSAWNFLLVRLDDASSYPRTKTAVQSAIAKLGSEAEVDDWRWGAGIIADLAYSIQIVFNIIVLIVSVVAIIIIMNTLVISVTERIPEIGTIRAIGGGKNFVRSMIAWETITISFAFGAVGILIGSASIAIANLVGIESSNMFFVLLFGGQVLRPTMSINAVVWSFVATAAIGTVSSLYPAAVALGISPVKAMQKV